MHKKVVLLIAIMMLMLCGCNNKTADSSEEAASKKYTIELTERQKKILRDEGLPEEYDQLTDSQKNAIVKIERALAYLEETYNDEFEYDRYVSCGLDGQYVTVKIKDRYPAKYVDVYITYKDDHYEYSDNYKEIMAESEYEEQVTDFLTGYFDPADFQVYVEISRLKEEGDSVVERAVGIPDIMINGVYSEEEVEEAAQAYAEWIADMEHKNGGGADFRVYETEEYSKINEYNYREYFGNGVFWLSITVHSDKSVDITRHGFEEPDASTVQTRTIVFPDRFEHLSSMNEEKLAEFFKEHGDGNYTALSIEDGLLNLSVNEEQEEYWKAFAAEQADKQESLLKAVSPKYSASCNKSHDTISVYYDALMPFEDALDYVGRANIFCAMYQLFDGAEDFTLSLNIYNTDTGKLVAGGNLEEDDVSYDNREWGLSYTLSEEEAEELTGADIQEYDVIRAKSTFIDGMSVIDILQQSGGNDYKYLYLDENNTVVMAVDENQKSNYLENMVRYLEDIKSQFEKLGDSYEITWNDEFSALDLYFDSSLSKQEQTNYLNYTETLCMLCQLLSGDGESYYIDIRIHDSSTGALISEGNTVDGITFNIGDK